MKQHIGKACMDGIKEFSPEEKILPNDKRFYEQVKKQLEENRNELKNSNEPRALPWGNIEAFRLENGEIPPHVQAKTGKAINAAKAVPGIRGIVQKFTR